MHNKSRCEKLLNISFHNPHRLMTLKIPNSLRCCGIDIVVEVNSKSIAKSAPESGEVHVGRAEIDILARDF